MLLPFLEELALIVVYTFIFAETRADATPAIVRRGHTPTPNFVENETTPRAADTVRLSKSGVCNSRCIHGLGWRWSPVPESFVAGELDDGRRGVVMRG